jgi:tRNA A37 threonylcarbamoyladenosine biosynthesis protein TsaE
MMMHTSHSVAGTEAVAAQLARGLRGGELIALHGELGAGKTQFARGIVAGLGGDPRAIEFALGAGDCDRPAGR